MEKISKILSKHFNRFLLLAILAFMLIFTLGIALNKMELSHPFVLIFCGSLFLFILAVIYILLSFEKISNSFIRYLNREYSTKIPLPDEET